MGKTTIMKQWIHRYDARRIRSHFPCRIADRFHDCSNRKHKDAPRRNSCIEFGGSSWNQNRETSLIDATGGFRPSSTVFPKMARSFYAVSFFWKSKKFQMVIYLSVCLSPAILPQNATKFTKMCSSEFGGLLWCHLTTQRKTAIGCTTTVPLVHNSPKNLLKNLLPVYFWCTQTCALLAIFGLPMWTMTTAASKAI